MNSNRLGCLSPLALIASLFTLAGIVAWAFLGGNGMFSAGSLNAQTGPLLHGFASHAATGSDCGQCHAPFWSRDTMTDRCLACHETIAAQLTDSASLHGAMKVDTLECRSCHPEHNGPVGLLTVMDIASFPHQQTGFSLQAHARKSDFSAFTCADCHADNLAVFNLSICQDCHQKIDPAFVTAHTIEYGDQCLGCHDGVETLGKNFNHRKTAFPLEGKHAEIQCAKCHLNARARADFKQGAADCATCHIEDDAHNGQFGRDCGACHSARAWEPASFDHNRAAFKLDGAHSNVECADCHKNNVFKGTPIECAACHNEPQLHVGMFPNQNCADCHTTAAWSPARYDGPHTFPMDHGEKNNTCADCHQPTLREWTCYTCHDQADVRSEHQDEGIGNFDDCLRCHPTGQEDDD